MWGLYLGRYPRLYTDALAVRGDCEAIHILPQMAANSPEAVTGNEKTDLYVSKDGSQLAKDGSYYHKSGLLLPYRN